MVDIIRFGMIGAGAVTEVKSGPAYQNTPGFSLVGVTRRDLEKANDYAKRHCVPQVFKDAQSLIISPDIDAVYIATPPDSHKELALQVAKAGKPCCIEKPLATTHRESEQIVEAFKNANVPLFVAYYRRSLPRFLHIKQMLANNMIGQVRHINWHLSKAASDIDLSKEYNWRTDKNIARAGYFDDLACHGLDLFAYLLGDYQKVQGIATNQQQLYSAFDAITATWLHHNGITGTASWNFGAQCRADQVTIYGSKGEIHFSVFEEQETILSSGNKTQRFAIENPKHIQQYHVQNMAEHLLKGIQHPSTGDTALHTSWVMEQILT